MMKFVTKHLVIFSVLTLALSNSQFLYADEFEEPFNPLKGNNISIIKLEQMNRIVTTCNLNDSELVTYWALTTSFVEIVNNLVEEQLKALDYKSPFNKPIHKQFLGVQTEEKKNLAYVFVYPQPSRVIKEEEGNPVLLCRKNAKDMIIFEFDKNNITFRQIKL